MFNEYENGDYQAAAVELADSDLIQDMIVDQKIEVFELQNLYYQRGSEPEDQNIIGQATKVISGYNQDTFEAQVSIGSEARLRGFSQRTNSEIAIGWTRNSVYNSVAIGDPKWTTTFYPIGDPPIMVSVNSNSEDPFGDFWKCQHGAYMAASGWTDEELSDVDWDVSEYAHGDDTMKNVIVETLDGIRYCMPVRQAELIHSHRTEKIDQWSRTQYGGGNFVSPAGTYRDPFTGELVVSTKGTVKDRIIPFQDWIDDIKANEAVLSFEIPFTSELIDAMGANPAADAEIGPYDAIAASQSLSFYREERLKSLYKARALPRENEYEVTYNVVEREALKSRFGQPHDLSTTLNNMYIGLATFLATTFIEVAYTFKKVDAPKISPDQIAPPNLALAPDTTIIDMQPTDRTLRKLTPGYYPSDYVDSYSGEAYRSPEPPPGGWYDSEYYMILASSTMEVEATEAPGTGPTGDFASDELGGGGDLYVGSL